MDWEAERDVPGCDGVLERYVGVEAVEKVEEYELRERNDALE